MAKKKAKKKAAKKAPKMEMLLVGSKTKDALRKFGVNVGEGTLDALNGMLYWYIEQAAKRAGANKRKTVRGHDIAIM